MSRGRTVLIATDGSPTAGAALSWAGAYAAATGARVVVVHCATDVGEAGGRDAPASECEEVVASWASPLSDAGVDHRVEVVVGDPREVIPSVADRVGADLVVVGSRGEGGFDDLVVGRVAHHLVHSLCRPTAVVPAVHGPIDRGTVVVGVDGSEANRAAVEWAVATASRIDGIVEAAFVHDPLADSYPHGDASNWKYRGQRDAERLVESVAGRGDPSVRFRNRGGNIVEALVDLADETNAAMIVVGTRGRWSFGGSAIGHVASQLPSHSDVPVVVVPHR